MPPRSIALAIVLFWLGVNAWLFYREVWPHWRSGEPPAYTIDLTEELGHASTNWEIWKKDKRMGHAVSRVERQRDRTYKLQIQLTFKEFRVFVLDVKKLGCVYHVSEDGELFDMSAHLLAAMDEALGGLELNFEMRGKVENGELLSELFLNRQPMKLGEIKAPVASQGSALNPLHPLNRLPGLREGRRWRVPLFDPMSALAKGSPELKALAKPLEGMGPRELLAEVRGDTLHWDGQVVDCFKIEYRTPGDGDLVASTHVRRRDGLILQQYSQHGHLELTLKRAPIR